MFTINYSRFSISRAIRTKTAGASSPCHFIVCCICLAKADVCLTYALLNPLVEFRLGHLRQRRKGRRIMNGDVGQNLAVDLDIRQLQSVDQAAIAEAIEA